MIGFNKDLEKTQLLSGMLTPATQSIERHIVMRGSADHSLSNENSHDHRPAVFRIKGQSVMRDVSPITIFNQKSNAASMVQEDDSSMPVLFKRSESHNSFKRQK